MCVSKILAVSQQQVEIGNLLQRMGSFYLRHFDPEHQGKNIYIKIQGQRHVGPNYQGLGQNYGNLAPQRSLIAHSDRNHHVLAQKQNNYIFPLLTFWPQFHSSSLLVSLLMSEESSFICFQCGLTRNAGCRKVARQENKESC